MKKLLLTLLVGTSALAGADGISMYTGAEMDNDNQSGVNSMLGKIYLNYDFNSNLSVGNNSKFTYDETSFDALKNDHYETANYFQNQVFDNTTYLNYQFDSGWHVGGEYRIYHYIDQGSSKSRQAASFGYASDLVGNLSQDTYAVAYRYDNNRFKPLLENDLTYNFNDKWKIGTELSVYKYMNTNVIDDSLNLDGTLKVTYNPVKNLKLSLAQELERNLTSNELINTTLVEVGYTWH